MNMCRKCRKWLKDNDGYMSKQDKVVKQAECQIHPRMDNWRVLRTVKTLIAWGLEGEGHKITVGAPGCGTTRVVICLGDGWIHLRNAKLQLYDYEVPFLELLEAEGMIESKECSRDVFGVDPAAVRVTMKGFAWVKEEQLRKEAKAQEDLVVEFEKAQIS